TREDIAKKASSAFEFAQSEVGRTAFGMLRDGAEKAYGAYSRRGGGDGTARKEQELHEPWPGPRVGGSAGPASGGRRLAGPAPGGRRLAGPAPGPEGPPDGT